MNSSVKPPAFDLMRKEEALRAVEWVNEVDAQTGGLIFNPDIGGKCVGYSYRLREVLEASVNNGTWKDRCLALAEACIVSGEGVLAECIHDLILVTWLDMGDEEYASFIENILRRSAGEPEVPFRKKMTAQEWIKAFSGLDENFAASLARDSVSGAVVRAVEFHTDTVGFTASVEAAVSGLFEAAGDDPVKVGIVRTALAARAD